MLAGVRTVGCRRVGGGSRASRSSRTCRPGAALAASLDARRDHLRGLGRVHPAGRGRTARSASSARAARAVRRVPAARADLVLGRRGRADAAARARSRSRSAPEPLEADPGRRARGGLHHRRDRGARRREPVLVSTNLARRSALGRGARRARPPSGLRRLPHRAEGRGDRHGGDARPRRGRARRVHPQPAGRRRRRDSSSFTAMRQESPPASRDHRRPQGPRACPYSKGLMAQTISATGPRPGRAFELARKIEQRLDANGGGEIDIARSAHARRGGARRRGGRGHRAPLRQLAPARPARPPARGAARRHDRRGQVHDRDDARRTASA